MKKEEIIKFNNTHTEDWCKKSNDLGAVAVVLVSIHPDNPDLMEIFMSQKWELQEIINILLKLAMEFNNASEVENLPE